jgi:hypothetical protein
MTTSDRRTTRRLSCQFDVSFRRAGPILGQLRTATMRNVSMGGVCFHTTDDSLRAGTVIEIELQVPPRHGVLERGGRMRSLALVLWVEAGEPTHDPAQSGTPGSVVGAQFFHRPTLCEADLSRKPDAFKDFLRRPGHVHAAIEVMPG